MTDPHADLPEELRHLRNLIDSAKVNYSVSNLRSLIKAAADKAPPEDVIRMAQLIFNRGAEIARSQRN